MFMLWMIVALVPLLWAFGLSVSAIGALVSYVLVFAAATVAIQLVAVMVNEMMRAQPSASRAHLRPHHA